jgi:transcriptional regulator with XRE-family HTH domain
MTNAAEQVRSRSELEPDLADRLAKSLLVAGMSVAEMAAFQGVHRNSVGAWLNRRTQPKPANLRLWAIRTGVPYGWLCHGTWSEDESEASGQVNS